MTKLSKCLFCKMYYVMNYLRLIYFKARYKTFRNKYNIHPSFKFNGVDIEFYGNGIIEIAENCYVGNRSALASLEGQKITIGKNCSISHNVRIYTQNRNPIDIISNKDVIRFKKGDVNIGANCWIGANVFIVQGVNIGDNVVVGANSVVTKDIKSNVIVAGSPAKIIKENKFTAR